MNRRAGLRLLLDRQSQSGLIALSLLLLLLSLLLRPIKLPRNTFDYIVTFDISQSMNVTDYEMDGTPVSRVEFAREASRRVLRDLPCGSRVGWGVFTGYRTILLLAPVEICANYNDLLAALEQIDGRMRWSNASEITKGLYWAVLAAKETQSKPDIVFMSDGQEAPPLDPAYPPRIFEDLPIDPGRGWIIGTGGKALSAIPRVDEEGRQQGYWRANEVVQPYSTSEDAAIEPATEHLSSLREPHLQSLANQLGFQYARLSDVASLSAVLRDERFARRRPYPSDISWIPVALALALLVLCFRPILSPAAPPKVPGLPARLLSRG